MIGSLLHFIASRSNYIIKAKKYLHVCTISIWSKRSAFKC